jgi:hypothetical protein
MTPYLCDLEQLLTGVALLVIYRCTQPSDKYLFGLLLYQYFIRQKQVNTQLFSEKVGQR